MIIVSKLKADVTVQPPFPFPRNAVILTAIPAGRMPALPGKAATTWLNLIALAMACLPSAAVLAAADCQTLDSRFQQQVTASQMDAAEASLRQMGLGCPERIVQEDESYFTDTLASQAEALAKGGKLDAAEALLKRAKSNSWMVSSMRGYIASLRKPTDWGEVAQHYNYALELLTDPNDAALKQLPDLAATQKRLLALATDAQLLYGRPAPAPRDGQPHGILLAAARGIGIDHSKIMLPVHFDTNLASLNEDGKLSADTLAEFLLQQKPTSITLTGHADPRGKDIDNQVLSGQRAQTLAEYLRHKGVTAKITTDGKGESEPPTISDLNPPKELLWQRWRRVELSLDD